MRKATSVLWTVQPCWQEIERQRMQMVTLADVGCLLLQTPLSGFKQRKGMPWNPQREILNFATNYLVRISRRRHRTRRRCWTGRRRIRGRGKGTRGRTPEWATSISSPHQVKQDIGGKEKLIQNYFSDPQVEPCLSLLMCPLQIITRQSLAGKIHNSEPLEYKHTNIQISVSATKCAPTRA